MEDSCGEIAIRKSGVANVGRVGAEIVVSTASYGCITKKWVEHIGKSEASPSFSYFCPSTTFTTSLIIGSWVIGQSTAMLL